MNVLLTAPTRTLSDPDEWHVDGFLDEFKRIHDQMLDRSYAFVLGAGASKSSQIPTGAELVDRWLGELYQCDRDSGSIPIAEWATDTRLGIRNFKYNERAEHYSEVYKSRFRRNPESGPPYLEALMEKTEPSFGYTVLAHILSKTRHQVVVTTNFDNLVSDALFIYTETHPLICGHEQLAQYIQLRQRRPLVAKVHRDLFYEPQNTPEELNELAKSWQNALRRLFTNYTPIVIGYGGNDGTLMGFLQNLEDNCIPGTIFWCHVGDGKPTERILSVIRKQRGVYVRIPGFDELMLMLSERLGFKFLRPKDMLARAQRRYESYMKQIRLMSEKIQFSEVESPSHRHVSLAFENILDQMDAAELRNQWWFWEYRARREDEEKSQDAMFREGLKFCEDSARLHSHFASFLTDVCDKKDEAYEHHKRAYNLDPNDPTVVANYASFCAYSRQNNTEAERLFRNAISAQSTDDEFLYKYALFLARTGYRGNYEVEQYFRRALEMGPMNCFVLANYAWWLLKNGRYPEAMDIVVRALEYTANNMKQLKAELLLYLGLLRRIRGEDDTMELSQIKSMLAVEFKRVKWPLQDILLEASRKLASKDDIALYTGLVHAILSQEMVGELDECARWRSLSSLQKTSLRPRHALLHPSS